MTGNPAEPRRKRGPRGEERPKHLRHFLTGGEMQFLPRRGITGVLLPPHALELNLVEILWAWLKQNPLANGLRRMP